MPHLTLEYTANLEHAAPTPELMLALHHLLNSVAGIRIENCKSRWRKVGHWVVGAGQEESAFVHLDLRFMEGRPLEIQRAVGEGALTALRIHYKDVPQALNLQITVEVGEIRKATYFKFPEGTLGPTLVQDV
jgi:5-carboxymethyl-2-hydroxymuconate isomerase